MHFIGNDKIDFTHLGFNVTGTVTIGNELINVALNKGKGMPEGKMTMEAPTVRVSEFIKSFASKSLDPSSAATMDKLANVTLERPQIHGARDGKGML